MPVGLKVELNQTFRDNIVSLNFFADISDLDLVNELSGGLVDLTYGR
jgi:hypothetical protein